MFFYYYFDTLFISLASNDLNEFLLFHLVLPSALRRLC